MKLSALTAAPADGDWVSPGVEFDDLEIHTRGYSDQYREVLKKKLGKAARAYGGDINAVPDAVSRKISTEALLDHVTLGVRNLENPDGSQVTFEDLRTMVHEPQFRPLLDALYAAANIVQARRVSDLEDARPLSEKPSA